MPKIPEQPTEGRPWGRALRRTPDEIVKLSRVTKDDVKAAKAHWRKNVKGPLKGLLKARPKRKGKGS